MPRIKKHIVNRTEQPSTVLESKKTFAERYAIIIASVMTFMGVVFTCLFNASKKDFPAVTIINNYSSAVHDTIYLLKSESATYFLGAEDFRKKP
jgi:hypothetical protein